MMPLLFALHLALPVQSVAKPREPEISEPAIPLETVKKPKRKTFGVGNHRVEEASSEPGDFALEDPSQDALLALVKVTGVLGVAGPLGSGPTVSFELGYRFCFGPHAFGLSIAPEVGAAWKQQQLSAVVSASASTFRLRVPLLISGNFAFGPHLVRVAVGPSFDWFSRYAAGGGLAIRDSYASLGLRSAASYLHALGSGALGAEVAYHLARGVSRNQAFLDHSLSVSLVYLVAF